MLKAFLVATNSDYTVLTLAETNEEAVQKAADFYVDEYGEDRDDWVAYDLVTEYLEPDEVLAIRSWME